MEWGVEGGVPRDHPLHAKPPFSTGLRNLTFASQNCNSLNISSNCPNQSKKIAALLSLSASIIFLSDTRLNSEKNIDAGNLFKNSSNDAYTLYHNSVYSKRGVGILVSKKITYTLIDEYKDPVGNILGLVISIDEQKILLVAVYGPNNNDVRFFENLSTLLSKYSNLLTICAGDWNLTYSTDNTSDNIDILNMKAPPQQF
jgi:hypothetical protein